MSAPCVLASRRPAHPGNEGHPETSSKSGGYGVETASLKLPLPLFLVTVTRMLRVPQTVDEADARAPPLTTAKAVPKLRA